MRIVTVGGGAGPVLERQAVGYLVVVSLRAHSCRLLVLRAAANL